MAQIAEYLRKDPRTQKTCVPIFSAIALKRKTEKLFAPMDFQNLSLDALIDSGALVNRISEADYRKIHQMSSNVIVKEMEPSPFKLQVANDDIEAPTKNTPPV